MNSENFDKKDIVENIWNNSQVDNFPKTTKFLLNEKVKNRDQIKDVLNSDSYLRKLFEELLWSLSLKNINVLKNNLINCKTENEIKSIIIENIPWWYKIWDNAENFYAIHKDIFVENETKAEENETKAEENETKAEITSNKEIVEQAINKALEARLQLVAKYPELEQQTQKWTQLYENIKYKLENNWTLSQLRKSNYDDKFINNYILIQATLLELKSNPDIYWKDEISRFDKIVKNLDNSCNIPDTNLSSFSDKSISQTRQEIFNSEIWNKNLIETKNKNRKSHESEYENIFTEMKDDEIIINYWKFLENNLNNLWKRFIENKDDLASDEYSLLLSYSKKVKNAVEEKTKDFIEEMSILSQIKWMYMCLWPDFWEKFQLNKSNEIRNDNWVLTIDWNIDWIQFSLRQDTKNPRNRLQTYSNLTKKDNSFLLWWNYEDSPFILPTQSEVFEIAAETIQSDSILGESSNPKEYLQLLQTTISNKMDSVYEDTKFTHHYLKDKIMWEKISNKTIWLIQQLKKSELSWPINDKNKKLFDFVNFIDFNIKNSTIQEKEKMDQCLYKIQEIIKLHRDNSQILENMRYPAIIKDYLINKDISDNTEKLLNGNLISWETIFDLFQKYKNPSDQRSDWVLWMINFDDLYRDLFIFEQNPSLTASNREAEKDRKNADLVLEQELKWL